MIRGVPRLSAAPVRAPDIRAGAALVIAALVADGVTEVADVHHIDRGYAGLRAQALVSLGARGPSRRRSGRDPRTRRSFVDPVQLPPDALAPRGHRRPRWTRRSLRPAVVTWGAVAGASASSSSGNLVLAQVLVADHRAAR